MTEADGGAAHSNENVRDSLGDEWSESAQHFIHAKRLSRIKPRAHRALRACRAAHRRIPHAHQSQLAPYDRRGASASCLLLTMIISGHMYSGVPMNDCLVRFQAPTNKEERID
jgi:hypothetical protein